MVKSVQDLLYSELTNKIAKEMPILTNMVIELETSRPFDQINIAVTHVVVNNSCPMLAALKAGGANVTICSIPDLRQDEQIMQALPEYGFNITTEIGSIDVDYALDCGGYFAETTSPPHGVVEVTRSGIHKYEQIKPQYSLIDVDSSRCKLLETFIGNPISVHQAMKKYELSDDFLHDSLLVILGFGKIGRGNARYFQNLVGKLIVLDISEKVVTKAKSLGFSAYQITDDIDMNSSYLKKADILISATGYKDTVSNYFHSSALTSCVKINLGAVDEFGVDYSDTDILGGKRNPFNFTMDPPTPSKFIDAILALQVYGLRYLVEKNTELPRDRIIIPELYDLKVYDEFIRHNMEYQDLIEKYFEL